MYQRGRNSKNRHCLKKIRKSSFTYNFYSKLQNFASFLPDISNLQKLSTALAENVVSPEEWF